MIDEDYFWQLWDDHKDKLCKLSGCFHVNRKFKYSANTCESQFEDFLKKFIPGYLKMGGSKIKSRIESFNFSLPIVDSLTPEDTGLCLEFLEGFRLGLYMFLNYKTVQQTNAIFQMNKDKRDLPIFKEKDTILESVRKNTVTIIIGDTGCGKSTQVPQYLIAAGWEHIVCTQPRRLSTISLSERVAKEMYCEETGDIGYQIRFESSGHGRKLKFVTEGVLIKQLLSDPLLQQYSLVIMDEVHERHIATDMLLGMLKLIAEKRADFRLVIMSATMDPDLYIEFFKKPLESTTESPLSIQVLTVPGRTYPVTIHYCPIDLEQGSTRHRGPKAERESVIRTDQDLDPAPYLRILREIDSQMDVNERGDVLIFLSGLREINILVNALTTFASSSGRWVILRLHSTLQSSEQQLIFNPTPPGVRKCILSTNIAETSITIPNVRYVIDSGKSKELSEPTLSGATTVQLHEFYISKSSARQRAGRAGRTGPGVCYRFYSEDDYYEMSEYTVPEILRGCIDDSILVFFLFKSMEIISSTFLTFQQFPLLQYPSDYTIHIAMKRLQYYGAITTSSTPIITSLGVLLSYLPLPIQQGYFLVLSAFLKQPYLGALLCSTLSFQSLFLNRQAQSSIEVNNRHKYANQYGDVISNLTILIDYVYARRRSDSTYKWCKNRMLSQTNLNNCLNIVTQLLSLLNATHLITHASTHLISRETHEEKRMHDAMRRDALKRRKVEVLDISHNDRVQREADFTSSIETTPSAEGGDMEEVDSDGEESMYLETMNGANKKMDIRSFAKLLEAACGKSLTSILSNDIELFFGFLISSIFYPNYAISSKSNAIRGSNEWTFLSKPHEGSQSLDLYLYPTSGITYYYSTYPDEMCEYPLQLNVLVYERILDTKKSYMTNVTVLPLLPSLLLLADEIDLDVDGHIVIDKWLYVSFDRNVEFPRIASILEQAMILRIKLNTLLSDRMKSLPLLSSIPESTRAHILEAEYSDKVHSFCESVKDIPLHLPSEIRGILDSVLETEKCDAEEPSKVIEKLIQFLRLRVSYSVDELSSSKAKAIYGLIPSCDELVASIAEQKKRLRESSTLTDAISALESVVQHDTEPKEDDYSERLGIADSVSDLNHLKRKGCQIAPWLWYESLTTNPEKANLEYYPDLIVDGMTVRWDCPLCHETMYVTKEELMNHLNMCVRYNV